MEKCLRINQRITNKYVNALNKRLFRWKRH